MDEFVGHDEYGRPVFQDAAGDMYVLDASDSDITSDPGYGELMERLAELETMFADQDAQAAQQQELAAMEQRVELMLDDLGVPEHQRDLVISRAVHLPATENGTPDLEAAVMELHKVNAAEHDPPPLSEFPEDGTRSDVVDWQVARAQQLERAQAEREERANAYAPPADDGDAWGSMSSNERSAAMADRLEAQ